eukprot:gene546-1959_t
MTCRAENLGEQGLVRSRFALPGEYDLVRSRFALPGEYDPREISFRSSRYYAPCQIAKFMPLTNTVRAHYLPDKAVACAPFCWEALHAMEDRNMCAPSRKPSQAHYLPSQSSGLSSRSAGRYYTRWQIAT